MSFVRKYKDLNTNLDELYQDIKKELQHDRDLTIANENIGVINNVPFMTITATRVALSLSLSLSLPPPFPLENYVW